MLPPLLKTFGELYPARDSVLRDVCILCRRNVVDVLSLGEFLNPGPCAAHLFCILLSKNILQTARNGGEISGFQTAEIYKTIELASTITCSYCSETGASLSCAEAGCNVRFHLPCGRRNGSAHQFHELYLSFCSAHRPVQAFYLPSIALPCPHCSVKIDYFDINNIIWTPCCKNAIHRHCGQYMALAKERPFNCPFCNNGAEFQHHAQNFGVYIPNCNLAAELVPSDNPMFRNENCCAIVCRNEDGRSFSGSNSWDVIVCSECRIIGIHTTCFGVKPKYRWICPICEKKLKVPQPSTSSKPKNKRKRTARPLNKTHETISKPSTKDVETVGPYIPNRPHVVRSDIARHLDFIIKPRTIDEQIALLSSITNHNLNEKEKKKKPPEKTSTFKPTALLSPVNNTNNQNEKDKIKKPTAKTLTFKPTALLSPVNNTNNQNEIDKIKKPTAKTLTFKPTALLSPVNNTNNQNEKDKIKKPTAKTLTFKPTALLSPVNNTNNQNEKDKIKKPTAKTLSFKPTALLSPVTNNSLNEKDKKKKPPAKTLTFKPTALLSPVTNNSPNEKDKKKKPPAKTLTFKPTALLSPVTNNSPNEKDKKKKPPAKTLTFKPTALLSPVIIKNLDEKDIKKRPSAKVAKNAVSKTVKIVKRKLQFGQTETSDSSTVEPMQSTSKATIIFPQHRHQTYTQKRPGVIHRQTLKIQDMKPNSSSDESLDEIIVPIENRDLSLDTIGYKKMKLSSKPESSESSENDEGDFLEPEFIVVD